MPNPLGKECGGVDRNVFNMRLMRFRELMAREELDTFLVAVPENRYYLSGYEAEDLQLTESSGYLLVGEAKQYLLTDFRYQEEAAAEAPDFKLVVYREGMDKELPDLFTSLKTKRVGIEEHFLTHQRFRQVREALKEVNPGGEVVPTEGLAEELRIVKEPGEVERIREAVSLSEKVLQTVWEALEPGMREKEVAWEVERLTREAGAQAVSFPPIVASGPNAALPHAVPTDRVIQRGDAVILDMGCRLNLYCSDMTRTWMADPPPERLKEIYRIVRDAQQAAREAAKPGMETTELDAVARDFIKKAGYEDHFGHGLGHGVGLAVHEKPGVRKFHPTVIQENMVITIEPGIYLPGYGGVRLENMARITTDGCEILNRLDCVYRW